MFLRMNFNRSATFLIFNTHCEQTWDDKEDSELKQSLRSFSNYFTEGDISCAGLLRFIQIFARKVIIIRLKFNILHTWQKSEASCALGFLLHFYTGFVGVLLLIQSFFTFLRRTL